MPHPDPEHLEDCLWVPPPGRRPEGRANPHAVRLNPGELTTVPIRAVFPDPGKYIITYRHDICGPRSSRYFYPYEDVQPEGG